MRKKYLLFLLFLISKDVLSQSLSPGVISTSGGFYSNSTAQLSFTAGEMSMVSTLTGSNSMLTQGFQQPFDFNTVVHDVLPVNLDLGVFPNPTSGDFNIVYNSKTSDEAKIIVYNDLGKIVLTQNVSVASGRQVIPLQLGQQSEGIYTIYFLSKESIAQNHSLLKIQLIK